MKVEAPPNEDKDASDNSSIEVVIANNILHEIEHDEDIVVEDEGDIYLVSQWSQASKPSTLHYTTDQPSSFQSLHTKYYTHILPQAKRG